MGKRTVKRRIFLSNTWMIIVTLFIFLIINLVAARVYTETIEHEFKASIEQMTDEDDLEGLFEDYTIHRNEFFLLVIVDGILCIIGLVLVSQLFTKKLTEHIMTPLNVLTEGAERIRVNDLSQSIEYQGDTEFEDVCGTFNDMQRSILTEQERNCRYEKARTDMIAGISHDLRTPLTAIRGTIKGLLDGVAATPEQQKKFLQTAYRRTGDMDILLNQLFYLSKLETGNMPLDMRTIGIADFITKYVRGKLEYCADGAFEIAVNTNGVTGQVAVDPEQFARIFDNLLENSRKYAEAAHLRVNISLDETSEGIRICFSDNGVGVAEEKLPYIFDEFYRADESRNKKDGNGLGLYIVKYLIEAMGGSVSAENADGFSVCMVLKKV